MSNITLYINRLIIITDVCPPLPALHPHKNFENCFEASFVNSLFVSFDVYKTTFRFLPISFARFTYRQCVFQFQIEQSNDPFQIPSDYARELLSRYFKWRFRCRHIRISTRRGHRDLTKKFSIKITSKTF